MLRHNLLLFYRSALHFKSSFFINLIGLSTGLACTLLIYLWVQHELSVDKFHKKDNQLYQVMFNIVTPQNIQTLDITPVPLAAALAEEMPEVEQAVSIDDFSSWRNREGILSSGNKHIKVKGLHAGKDFFNVLSFNLIQGNKNQVLADKTNIVVSEELAKKMFGTPENAIGKNLEWKHESFEGTYRVSGVFVPHPHSSMPKFDVIFTIDVLVEKLSWAKEWTGNYCKTFLVLKKGTDITQFNKKIAGFLKERNSILDKFPLFVQQYSAKYLYGNYENGIPVEGRVVYIRLFSIISVFILLIACINFINLSTAHASRRMKEVGIKKTLGVNRSTLTAQYLAESVIMALTSLLIAFVLVAVLLPKFNDITGKPLALNLDMNILLTSIGIAILTGIASGIYPAFYLSGFNAVAILKGKLDTSSREVLVRKGLVIFQYTLSVVFIVVFLVVNAQIKYAQTKDLGYNRNNIVSFRWHGNAEDRLNTFLLALKNLPDVENASNMSGNILNDIYGQSGISWRGVDTDRDYQFKSPVVGYDFIKTLGINLAEGRSFSREYADESKSVIINEAARKMMGLENPVGKTLKFGDEERTIIGVVNNFIYGSLHNPVEPLIFRFDAMGKNIMVKMKSGIKAVAIEQVKKLYENFQPMYPFEFTFLDEDYRSLYDSENRLAVLSKFFTLLAILISCLGLYGLASFTAEKRRKEIGVRKVLGAGIPQIILLLSKDFLLLVLLAICIGLPISLLATNRWLEGFAFKAHINWWLYALAAIAAIIIALFAVSSQAIKAAVSNPVKSLRAE